MKILAIADMHLGMKFSTYDEVGPDLSVARYTALEKCVEAANDEKCEIFVIAGDLFDRQNVSGSDIGKAADLLSRFAGSALLILPGNHDFYTGVDGGPWGAFVENIRSESVPAVLLFENHRYDLDHFDLPVSVFPGPCTAKHSHTDSISWIPTDEQGSEGKRLRLGIAHGSVEGLSPDPDGEYFPMTRKQLDEAPTDLWIIGHTHKSFPDEGRVQPKLFIPGTPEPDGFDCQHPGGAWILECSESGLESYKRIETGSYRFYDKSVVIEEASALSGSISPDDPGASLVSLNIKGTLDRHEYEKLPGVLEELRHRFFYFSAKLDGLEQIVSTQTVDEEFTRGSFPNRLVSAFIEDEDREAAQIAYRLLKGLEG
jgi:DNA repair protein SbcD/Mre11